LKPATLAAVAAYAGVTSAAASNYFNGKKRLSKERERKLEEGAALLNFTPRYLSSRPKANQNTRLICMCLLLGDKLDIDDFYFYNVFNGVLDFLSRHDYQLSVCHVVDGDQASYDRFFSGLRLVTGVILCNPRKDHRIEDELKKRGIPYVDHGQSIGSESAFSVDVDIQGVGFQAAEYLLGKGHQRILYINLMESMVQSQQRHDGFALAYTQRGLSFNESDHFYTTVSADACYQIVRKLFSEGSTYTAVVTSNEIQALGVINAMKELKLKIPSKVALLSMGGTMIGMLTTPSLTTIDFSPRKTGYEAAQLLLEVLDKKRIQPFRLIFPGNLVERDSTK
jgi:DNA-binding LacI/PurR family transcriptional regulator